MKRKDADTDGESGADERLHSAEWMDALARIETLRPRVASRSDVSSEPAGVVTRREDDAGPDAAEFARGSR